MKSITLTQLNYIVAVFQTRNFGSAAKNCFISQPTLSMQIQKLEEDLGVTLFDRSKKPVEPTDGKVLAYLSPDHPLLSLSTISEKDLSLDDIWLLNEGHCFRDQAIAVCKKIRGKNVRRKNLIFESGNLETLKRLVDQKFGYTLLPWLATLGIPALEQKKKIRFFKAPVPTREVSIVYTRSYLKKSIIEVLHKDIVSSLPKKLKNSKIKERVIGISSLK